MAMPMLSVACGARATPVIVLMQMCLLKLFCVVIANTAPNNMNSGVTLTKSNKTGSSRKAMPAGGNKKCS